MKPLLAVINPLFMFYCFKVTLVAIGIIKIVYSLAKKGVEGVGIYKIDESHLS